MRSSPLGSWSIVALAILTLDLVAVDAGAFDGSRRGFVIGGGLGPSLVTFSQDLSSPGISLSGERETKTGLATEFHLGAGLDDTTVITSCSRVGWISLEVISGFTGTDFLTRDVTITSAVQSLMLTRYGEPSAPSSFLRAGVGFAVWDAPFEEDAGDPAVGLGLAGGIGYEFRSHWSVELGVTWGRTTVDVGNAELQTNALSVHVGVVGTAY